MEVNLLVKGSVCGVFSYTLVVLGNLCSPQLPQPVYFYICKSIK